jgi:hypothetical protein
MKVAGNEMRRKGGKREDIAAAAAAAADMYTHASVRRPTHATLRRFS